MKGEILGRLGKTLVIILLFLGCIGGEALAATHLKEGSLIRDVEIESFIRDCLTPIYKVAGLDSKRLEIYVLIDKDINAFALPPSTIALHSGLLTKTEHVGQLIGVLAHETGHIEGGHGIGRYKASKAAGNTQMAMAALGLLLSIASPELGLAIVSATTNIGMAKLLHYSRGQESAADQAASKYLEKLGWSTKGMMEMMDTMKDEALIMSRENQAYRSTHPPHSERISFFKHKTETSAFTGTPFPDDLVNKYERIKTKIKAFLMPPAKALLQFPATDKSFIARYGRAIALHQSNKRVEALQLITELIQENPNDSFLHELKGQMLFEGGDLQKALVHYQKALQLNPKSDLLRIMVAHVMIETGNSKLNQQAIRMLHKASRREKEDQLLWRLLATAYGRDKQPDMAALMLAEQALLLGNKNRAKSLVGRALKMLPESKVPARTRANDIVNQLNLEKS